MAPGHSGLQKEVLGLYRRYERHYISSESLLNILSSALRMVQSKPPPARPKFRLFVRYTFKTQVASVSPRDVAAIEHLIRKGKRQLETYEDPKVRDIWVSNAMREWQQKDGGGRRETQS